MISKLIERVRKCFVEAFGYDPEWTARAPGRVNLLGEHVDYNGGLVLPMGIERNTVVAIGRTTDQIRTPSPYPLPRNGRRANEGQAAHRGQGQPGTVRVYSENLRESAEFRIDQLQPSTNPSWRSYVAGVIAQIEARLGEARELGSSQEANPSQAMPGMDIAIASDVPIGSGLSSSAALTVGLATVLNELLELRLSVTEVARLCRAAEHEYAGVPCGLMDPLCIAACKEGHCMLLDCQSDEFQLLPLDDSEVVILIADTTANRELASGSYALRRRECEAAATACGAKSLREVTLEKLGQSVPENMKSPSRYPLPRSGRRGNKSGMGENTMLAGEMDDVLYRRAKHVVEEIGRVEHAAETLKQRQWREFGKLMNASHQSLRDLFEVSCPELDAMVEIAWSLDGVLGSRMTGGGFGGCTVSLVQAQQAQDVERRLSAEYFRRTGIRPELFFSRPSDGARILERPGAVV